MSDIREKFVIHKGRLMSEKYFESTAFMFENDAEYVINSINSRERQAYLLGLCFSSAFQTKQVLDSIAKGYEVLRKPNPAEVRELALVENALKELGLQPKNFRNMELPKDE